ncbi:hypothetical protein DXT68_09165 [Microbacterium foliorum]|uniref:Flagellar FliJ protein n=1 Tax=Microbacterium foliorum TaxID=104336 RepID=A0A0F0KV25_9MICO|nr:flagellar FliJ family protein [Microbacterium foliorum]AXL12290.1 hypothetical protein DXT68_09165 [Microbacterium foliorum]KJL24713.1 hypothetical protein RN50_00623 [Microbacterium foliorum]
MTFTLSGLLRVRGAQARVAAEHLSRASAERTDAEDAATGAASSLSDISAQIDDPRALMAMAAARAAGRSTLSDLQALVEMRRLEESSARSAHIDARRELKGLERLEDAHRAEAARADLAAEQSALDEIAVARTARRAGSAA